MTAPGANCDKCHQVHVPPPRCQAHTKNGPHVGEQCHQFVRRGSGLTVCDKHGMNNRAKTAGVRRATEAKAAKIMATYGISSDLDPTNVDAVTEVLVEIARTRGHIDWLATVIAELDPEALTWGRSGREVKVGGGPTGDFTAESEASGVNVHLELYLRERKHLVDVCKAAIAAGIAERQVKLAEQQGNLIAEVFRAVLADPVLALDDTQQAVARAVVARHLRALPPAA